MWLFEPTLFKSIEELFGDDDIDLLRDAAENRVKRKTSFRMGIGLQEWGSGVDQEVG